METRVPRGTDSRAGAPGRATRLRVLLLAASLLLSLGVGELGFRLLDPLPYFDRQEINKTEYGNLSRHDPLLGWSGVPGGEAEFVTENSRVLLRHNREGYRDVEHEAAPARPAIVFLGDSYTWGYEVEFGDMFVSRLQTRLPGWELYNLGHRGYGTDQSLLALRGWKQAGDVRFVVLMFSDNDVDDNNAAARYYKPKPRFVIEEGKLVLTGVPVPRTAAWQPAPASRNAAPRTARVRALLLRSHLVHHVYSGLWRRALDHLAAKREAGSTAPQAPVPSPSPRDGPGAGPASPPATDRMAVTVALLRALRDDAKGRGATLVVAFIPAPSDLERKPEAPYQLAIASACDELGIDRLDFLPGLRRSWLRTTYRFSGKHWNARGHRLAADMLYDFLVNEEGLRPGGESASPASAAGRSRARPPG